jgi:hypothetical protein
MWIRPPPLDIPRRWVLESAAGALIFADLEMSDDPVPYGRRRVRLANRETTIIPPFLDADPPLELDVRPPANIPEIEDVAAFSANAVQSAFAGVEPIESIADLALLDFYAGDPFVVQHLGAVPVVAMTHPMERRIQLPPADYEILGPPTEW